MWFLQPLLEVEFWEPRLLQPLLEVDFWELRFLQPLFEADFWEPRSLQPPLEVDFWEPRSLQAPPEASCPPPEDPPTLDGDVQRLAPGRRHPRPAHVLLEPAAEGPAEAPRGLRDEELGGTPRGGPGGVFGAGGALRDLDPVPVEAEAQPGAGPGGQAGTGTGSDGT